MGKKTSLNFETIKNGPGFLLWQSGAAWRREVEAALHTLGLTYAQFVILCGVSFFTKEKKLVSQVEVATFCKTNITMTSQILRKLEAAGYTKRTMNPGNEKSKFPVATKEGSDLSKKAIALVTKVDNTFFAEIEKDLSKYKTLSATLFSYEE